MTRQKDLLKEKASSLGEGLFKDAGKTPREVKATAPKTPKSRKAEEVEKAEDNTPEKKKHLCIDISDSGDYLRIMAMKNHTSMTAYLHGLILKDMKKNKDFYEKAKDAMEIFNG